MRRLQVAGPREHDREKWRPGRQKRVEAGRSGGPGPDPLQIHTCAPKVSPDLPPSAQAVRPSSPLLCKLTKCRRVCLLRPGWGQCCLGLQMCWCWASLPRRSGFVLSGPHRHARVARSVIIPPPPQRNEYFFANGLDHMTKRGLAMQASHIHIRPPALSGIGRPLNFCTAQRLLDGCRMSGRVLGAMLHPDESVACFDYCQTQRYRQRQLQK